MTYRIDYPVTDWQRQVIIGTVLGGSSIIKPKKGRNCYLSMRGKSAHWLECKTQELHFPRAQNPYYVENRRYFRWHSACLPLFNEFHKLLYDNGKRKVDIEVLNGLRDIGLAVWFLDAGSIRVNKLYMSVSWFADESIATICRYFQEIDLDNEIVGKSIVFSELSTKRFLRVVVDFVPKFMFYKLESKK